MGTDFTQRTILHPGGGRYVTSMSGCTLHQGHGVRWCDLQNGNRRTRGAILGAGIRIGPDGEMVKWCIGWKFEWWVGNLHKMRNDSCIFKKILKRVLQNCGCFFCYWLKGNKWKYTVKSYWGVQSPKAQHPPAKCENVSKLLVPALFQSYSTHKWILPQ